MKHSDYINKIKNDPEYIRGVKIMNRNQTIKKLLFLLIPLGYILLQKYIFYVHEYEIDMDKAKL